ncbi:hypothetical protein [Bradyrhizobium erythrophlei]|uniref:hypothetical protein n=1 Tax=Bradyrhizobium erythrophlei TaxID=1437360 RepID=UPI000B859F25|nr:hypothetical protein [Bradyrhizobium erythrophlei]
MAEYRADRRYAKLDPKSKRNHEVGFKLVGGYVLKDGKRLGEKRIVSIDTALTDDWYEKLLILKTEDKVGNVIERERRTTVNHIILRLRERREHPACLWRQARSTPRTEVDRTFSTGRCPPLLGSGRGP